MRRVLGLLALVGACLAQPIVNTEYGQVMGRLVEQVFNGEFSADVNAFHGVPYAADTSGENRFRYPVKRTPWSPEIFEALELGQGCPQGGGGLTDFTHPGYDNYGEDCLNVDIYTPVTPGPHPVMVWFHGGAYQGGTNIQYPGHFLATRDLVIVVANYRLGDFGFAYTGNDACPGNFGLMDQRMALEFVQSNIVGFGGDPNRVTIFGQSAGASSTALHTVSPLSQGEDLHHQAICESGTEWNFWSVNLPESTPENYIKEVAAELNCTGGDDYEMMDCLRTIPWDDLRRADFDCTPGWYCLGMAPVVDGVFLPDRPRNLRESGEFLKGPIMTGLMEADGSFYTMGMIPESVLGGFNHSEWMYHLETDLMVIWAPLFDNDTYDDVLKAVEYNYSPWPYIEDEYVNRDMFNKMITDAAFGNPWDRQMRHHSDAGYDIFGYVYGYRGRNASDLVPEWMGVPHMGELPQVWGWTLLPFNDQVRNDSGFANDIIDWTDEDRAQTIYINKLYENFARFGNPTPTPVADPLGGETTWPPYTFDDMAVLYIYNTTTDVVREWETHDYVFWEGYMGYVGREVWEGLGIPKRPAYGYGPSGDSVKGMSGRYADKMERATWQAMLDGLW